jgi:hypothetical protein
MENIGHALASKRFGGSIVPSGIVFQAESQLEVPLRKFVLFFATVFAFSFLASFASAQQADAMFGFGTIESPGSTSCGFNSSGYTVCPEKGGLYPSISADVIFHRRIGFAYDVTWRGGQGAYPETGQPYRPVINDFNAIYEPRLAKKVSLDLMAGVGVQSTRFYTYTTCTYLYCTDFNSNHNFLVHVGGGIKYYVWNHVFVRPEFHYYEIHDNTNNFSGNNVIRIGGSIGYTIGGPE